MPTYGFRCLDCSKRFEVYIFYQDYEKTDVLCPHCKSKNVQRQITRIRLKRSEGNLLSNLADPNVLDGLEEDPRSMGCMLRSMKKEMGEDLGPEFDEVAGRLEAGQSPEDIEKELPDLGGMTDTNPAGFNDIDDF